jgi:hypothetical protein
MYHVRIKAESFRGKPQWVARDDFNNWRAYCGIERAENAKEAARQMFHEDEIESIVLTGEVALAVIGQ